MTTGPQGQKRPRDVVGCAVHVAKIATGQIDETEPTANPKEKRAAGGKARAKAMTPEQRSASARKAAQARWG